MARIVSTYKSAATRRLLADPKGAVIWEFGQLSNNAVIEINSCFVDCETVVYDFARREILTNCDQREDIIPLVFVPWEKPDAFDNLLAAFGALAISQITGRLPNEGTLIYGDYYCRKTLQIESHIARTRQVIDDLRATWREKKPPTLALNWHCAVCDFRPRCSGIATERDDLSLLTGMTVKERTKCAAKGISTITQLSYGYRPRRRKRTRPDAERTKKSARRNAANAKNDFKLKALAIKKSQIHVVGAQPLNFEGVPTFLDVEGMNDRDFYYLIGLRFERDGALTERSFWADRPAGERDIWESCLQTLKEIENPQIVSYGAYETRFLRQMRERYVHESSEGEFVDRLIKTSVNLVNRIYGTIYFPTHSNSLKEVARYLGHDWTWTHASGAAAPLLRRAWELGADDELKRDLIGYNMSDCRAATTVASALARICGGGASDLGAVDVSSLEVRFRHTFGKLDCALPEFKKINDAAYWDYQRSRVYARTDKTIRRCARNRKRRSKSAAVEKEVEVDNVPDLCPRCQGTRFWI